MNYKTLGSTGTLHSKVCNIEAISADDFCFSNLDPDSFLLKRGEEPICIAGCPCHQLQQGPVSRILGAD